MPSKKGEKMLHLKLVYYRIYAALFKPVEEAKLFGNEAYLGQSFQANDRAGRDHSSETWYIDADKRR